MTFPAYEADYVHIMGELGQDFLIKVTPNMTDADFAFKVGRVVGLPPDCDSCSLIRWADPGHTQHQGM